jgi:DNA-binding GntR family transcriptional regulator
MVVYLYTREGDYKMLDYKNLSLADQAYQVIEEKILNGSYPFGKILSETKLSKELGVSRTPIREALARLESEKLVSSSSTGTMVIGINAKDMQDMYQVKFLLEPKALEMAIDNMTSETLEKLKDILEQQEFFLLKSNTKKVENLDTKFHDIIYAQCGNSVIESTLSPIHHRLLKYRNASLEDDNRKYLSYKEHEAIYKAICDGDKEKAVKLMAEHINNSYESIMKGKGEK